jgi:3D (Asp-Asp-Asp) domain-containing protein
MHVVATRRYGPRQVLAHLFTGLITSVALIGSQPLSTVQAVTVERPTANSDVDGAVARALPVPDLGHPALDAQAIWTAPSLPDYPFERVAPETVTPAATPEPTPEIAAAPEEAEAPAPRESLIDVGIASTYGEGDGFQGRRTACGQRFDTNVPQVAHKTLPCGTMVRVEDAATGKSVVAQVTDRGPYIRGRVVDLSWAAFSQLRRSPDLVSVRVYRIEG